ncbi:MAG: histidinol-phosphate aminotransferase family protein [Hymenobacter sp.]|nr:MAG: histidinol-phosphate aminotransferase family protein [Hymenobacter sp.]
METRMNRRHWLKSGALLAGSAALLPTGLEALAAPGPAAALAPAVPAWLPLTEQEALLAAAPALKARLLANENPFGPSEKAKKAIANSVATCYQYPPQSRELAQKIAEYEDLTPGHILLDAGSSPLLLAAAMHYGQQGAIITGDPSYADLTRKAEKFKAPIVAVPLTADYKLDLDAMERKVDARTGLVYICNPNNPTGTVLDAAKLKDFTARVSKKVPIFIDEAYIDYLPDPRAASLMSAVKQGQNVLVARTFSKLYGFAGLRVGYVVGQPDTIKLLSQYAVGPMSISAPAVQAALVSYQDQAYMQEALQKTVASRQFLYDTLKREGYEYIPSSANFVMFPLKMDGPRFVEEMMKRGVGVRNWQFAGKQWCRVSIGRMDEMQAFAAAFGQLS